MNNSFSYLLNLYLTNYLVIQRNMSSNTIRSYKCTFKLFIKYITDVKNIAIRNINFDVIDRETIIDFLDYIENENNGNEYQQKYGFTYEELKYFLKVIRRKYWKKC